VGQERLTQQALVAESVDMSPRCQVRRRKRRNVFGQRESPPPQVESTQIIQQPEVLGRARCREGNSSDGVIGITGDQQLRDAARRHGVSKIGTLGDGQIGA